MASAHALTRCLAASSNPGPRLPQAAGIGSAPTATGIVSWINSWHDFDKAIVEKQVCGGAREGCSPETAPERMLVACAVRTSSCPSARVRRSTRAFPSRTCCCGPSASPPTPSPPAFPTTRVAGPRVRTRPPRSACACQVAHAFQYACVTDGTGKSKQKGKRKRGDSSDSSDSEENDERYQKLNVRGRRSPRTGTARARVCSHVLCVTTPTLFTTLYPSACVLPCCASVCCAHGVLS
jgi:hypothetical protein